MRRTPLLLLLVLVLLAGLYGGLDVRQRARVDRGLRAHRTDFTVYQAAARALDEGTDPYEARNPRGYPYVYPPLLAILLMPLGPARPPDAALVFYALSLAALGAALLALARMPWGPGRVGWRPTLVGTAVALPFLHQSFERGQVTVALVAIQVGALVLLVRRREVVAGALLAFGGALRLTPLLPAAAVGLGLLAAWRRRGGRPFLRLSVGVAGGLLAFFVLIPVAVLGPARARTVTQRWLETSEAVFAAPPGRLADLEEMANINEYRFKNQAPRRVFATWTGWAAGASFEDERPSLSDAAWRAVDDAARVVTALAVLLAALLGWRRLRAPDDRGFALAFALVGFLPVLAVRYAWPTHYTVVLPLVALLVAADGLVARPGRLVGVFVAGEALFYLAHVARPLEPVGAAGPLLLASVLLVVGASRAGRAPRDAPLPLRGARPGAGPPPPRSR